MFRYPGNFYFGCEVPLTIPYRVLGRAMPSFSILGAIYSCLIGIYSTVVPYTLV